MRWRPAWWLYGKHRRRQLLEWLERVKVPMDCQRNEGMSKSSEWQASVEVRWQMELKSTKAQLQKRLAAKSLAESFSAELRR